jgi:Mrp family chromosome partitioning ATPase
VERLLQLRSSPGFCEVLSGESPLSMALQPSGVHDLWVLASGRSSSADIDVLHSGSIDEFLRASDLVDYVIIDAAPLVSVADALVIAGSVDGVVIAADGRSVKREDAIRAREELEQVGARLLGSIVTNAPKVRANAGYPRSRQEPAGAKKKKKKQKKSEGAAGGFSPDRPTGVVTGAQAEPNGRKADDQDDAQAWLERTENAPGQGHPVAR